MKRLDGSYNRVFFKISQIFGRRVLRVFDSQNRSVVGDFFFEQASVSFKNETDGGVANGVSRYGESFLQSRDAIFAESFFLESQNAATIWRIGVWL